MLHVALYALRIGGTFQLLDDAWVGEKPRQPLSNHLSFACNQGRDCVISDRDHLLAKLVLTSVVAMSDHNRLSLNAETNVQMSTSNAPYLLLDALIRSQLEKNKNDNIDLLIRHEIEFLSENRQQELDLNQFRALLQLRRQYGGSLSFTNGSYAYDNPGSGIADAILGISGSVCSGIAKVVTTIVGVN